VDAAVFQECFDVLVIGEGLALFFESGVLFRLACCALMNTDFSSINPSPGVARQLLTFFVSPKKVSKERRPRDPVPSDFPVLRSKKWEGK
jgi:hypothetical protein